MAGVSSGERDADGLDPRQQIFVSRILAGDNITKAAIAAGYAEGTAAKSGSRLLRTGKVSAVIARRRAAANVAVVDIAAAQKAKDAESFAQLEATQVLRAFAAIAFTDITQVVSISDKGVMVVKDLESLPQSVRLAISEVQATDKGIRVKLEPKMAALMALGRHLGLFLEEFSPEQIRRMTDAELAKVIEAETKAPLRLVSK